MELQDLAHSPNFPRRTVSGHSSTPLSHAPKLSKSPMANTESLPQATDDISVSSSEKSKSWLQFNPGDFLSRGKKSNSDNTSSPILKPARSGNGTSRKSKGESQIEKADKVYTVSAEDASMLERITQRAKDRELRIRKPHEVFVELEEIRMDPSDELEWAETARWIKFEEEVEEGSGRWGRPHISALAFHSLVELKRGLDGGCVLLDLEGETFPAIVDQIVSGLAVSGALPAGCCDQVRMLLLKKHRHSHDTSLWEKIKTSAAEGTLHQIGEGIRRKSFADLAHPKTPSSSDLHTSPAPLEKKPTLSHVPLLLEESEEKFSDTPNSTPTSATSFVPPPSSSSLKKVSFSQDHTSLLTEDSSGYLTGSTHGDHAHAYDVMKEAESDMEAPPPWLHKRHRGSTLISKIPDEAESLTVLVGGVKFLDEPITAFVRLGESLNHEDLMEAPVPVRFIFLQIGPDDESTDYHEVGRAMATLMSDAHFHELAYSASAKEQLIGGLDEFLDNSLVLPPGDWGEDLLLPAIHEHNNLRKRKEDHKEAIESYQKMVTEPLRHSRRPCGGMWRDLKNLVSRYVSDFRDALSIQVFVSIIFLYISFLAPAIAFGGLMEEVTQNYIGETETLFATGLGGIVYGLFAVQPLTVLAFTGPVLVFESIIYEFAVDYNIPYLEWRAIISLWLMLILLVLAISELTFLVHHFTRFCEEIFTGVVAVFFVYEACLSLIHTFQRNPICGLNYPCSHYTNSCFPLDDHHDDGNHSNDTFNATTDHMTDHVTGSGQGMVMTTVTMMMNGSMEYHNATPSLPRGFRICNQPNTALWSVILAVATFAIAVGLRKLRYKNFLGKKTRRLVSDFGMLTAITVAVVVAFLARNFITFEVLLVPPNYSVSRPAVRGWFINPFNGNVSVGAAFGALIPALLLAILLFVENQLAVILVNKPENKLSKPVGYHLDLCIVALLSGLCGLLGSPFLCGAPVRSIQHMQALSVFTKKHAPGEKPQLVRVHEQRVTTLLVHILIIFTPFASVVLEVIPISVVLGVFWYLAFVSIIGVQLWKRIKLFLILPKRHPDVIYVKKVRTWKMHIYTGIQVLCVGLLFGLKLSPAAMVYPLMIVLLIPFRWALGKTLYDKDEIEALDNEENAKSEDPGGEIGEFEMSHVPY